MTQFELAHVVELAEIKLRLFHSISASDSAQTSLSKFLINHFKSKINPYH